jgi:hypothetical protein
MGRKQILANKFGVEIGQKGKVEDGNRNARSRPWYFDVEFLAERTMSVQSEGRM